MPKKAPKGPFFFYMLEFKRREEKCGRYFTRGLVEVSAAADPSWKALKPEQRAVYDKMAKEAKQQNSGGGGDGGNKFTSQGIPFAKIDRLKNDLERSEKNMKNKISEIVETAFINNTISTQEFFFVCGNYFCKTIDSFVPAELAIAKYSVEHSVQHKFHTYLNPVRLPMGFAYEAKAHSDSSHRLPIPPMSKGDDNYGRVLREISKFLSIDKSGNVPPMFTTDDQIPIIKSFLKQFAMDNDEDPEIYSVFPLSQLFFILKREVCKGGFSEDEGFMSIHIAQCMLDRDNYDYCHGIACQFHESEDVSKFCALSKIMRWAYTFSDHICLDLGIDMTPGQHLPKDADVTVIKKCDFDDTKSYVSSSTSVVSEMTDFSEAIKYQKPMSTVSGATSRTLQSYKSESDNNYPSLGAMRNKVAKDTTYGESSRDVKNPWKIPVPLAPSPDVENPWAVRSRRIPRRPTEESFNFSSAASTTGSGVGAGRGSIISSALNEVSGYSLGRGRVQRP